MNIEGFDFSNGLKCSDVHTFEKLNKLSICTFEFIVCQDQNERKHKLVPAEISKNNSDKVIDLLIYKNHYVLIRKSHMLLGKHDSKFVCRRCLSSN